MTAPALPERHPEHRGGASQQIELNRLASHEGQHGDRESSDTEPGDSLEDELPEGGSTQKLLVMVKHEDEDHRKRSSARKCCGDYPCFNAWGLLISVLAIVIVILIAMFITKPANDDTRRASDSTLEHQQWQDYYTWRWEVCPQELAQNISSPACEEATKAPTPVPPKPSTQHSKVLSRMVAQHFKILVNGSAVLDMSMASSSQRCLAYPYHDTSAPRDAWPCSYIITSARNFTLHNSVAKRQIKRTTTYLFPLPPTAMERSSSDDTQLIYWLRSDASWGGWFLEVLKASGIGLGIILAICLFFGALGVAATLNNKIGDAAVWMLKCLSLALQLNVMSWVVILVNLFWNVYVLIIAGRTWDLTNWTAVDDLLDECMASRSKAVPLSTHCKELFTKSTYLTKSEEIAVWSLWRTFVSDSMRRSTVANTIFIVAILGLVLNFVQVVLWGSMGILHCRYKRKFHNPYWRSTTYNY